MTRHWQFVAVVLAVAGVALAIRLPALGVRPMHGDEAVHTIKFETLRQTGRYDYDPHDYHGPTLYYLTFPVVWLTGATDLAATTEATFRIVPVIFGVALVLLLVMFGDGIGRAAAVCAAALIACSPMLVYYSRYYIQEPLLLFFTAAAIAAAWRYVRSRRIGWAVLTGACAGLMHATKETCVIAFGAAALAVLIVARFWQVSPNGLPGANETSKRVAPTAVARPLNLKHLAAAVLTGLSVSVLLFSVFFTNFDGPIASLRACADYFDRASGSVHDHAWYYYLMMLAYTHDAPGPVWSEGLILALALVGMVAVMGSKQVDHLDQRMLRFLVVYSLLMVVIYSAIPYKTPWCMAQFLFPLILLAGVGAVTLVRWVRFMPLRIIVAALLVAGTVHLGRQARAATGKYCADNRNPYAYAHPVHDVTRLAAWIEKLAAVQPDGHDMLIKVIADDPWPLPWYLRRFNRVGYWEKMPQDPRAPVVNTSPVIAESLAGLASDTDTPYRMYHYGLRPGTILVVCVREDLWQSFVARERLGDPVTTERAAP